MNKNKLNTRQNIKELYEIRSQISTMQRILELYRAFWSSTGSYSRKSPAMIAAEDLQKVFGLGRFVIFGWEKHSFMPILSAGLNLHSIKSFKLDQAKIRNARRIGDNEQINIEQTDWQLEQTEKVIILKQANLPAEFIDQFMFHYQDAECRMLFWGEDPAGELAKNCVNNEFNREIWPRIHDICQRGNSLKKNQEKIKDLENKIDNLARELAEARNKAAFKPLDTNLFLQLSNRIFSIYNTDQLMESYVDSICSMFSPKQLIVLTKSDEGTFKLTLTRGQVSSALRGLELSADSNIIKRLMDKQQAMMLTSQDCATIKEDTARDLTIGDGYKIADKLFANNEINAVVIMGNKGEGKQYDESDLGVLSTMSNMASLALGNINQYQQIERMSYTDSMTGLYNYRYFFKRLNEEIYRARRFNRMLGLAIFDIDNFKTVNDTFGHQAGDEVLKEMASLLLSGVRSIDIVSRYGGEEFCVIMPDTGLANCQIFIDRICLRVIQHKFKTSQLNQKQTISVSVGAAIYPDDAQNSDRLIYCADMALLKAKSCGRNRGLMFTAQMLDNSVVNESNDNKSDMENYENN